MDRDFSFLLWPKREARGPWKQGRKKRGSITCRTDRANEANKMFIIWLCWLFRFWKDDRELEVRTATHAPGIDQSQHAKSVSHIIIYLNIRTNAITKSSNQWSSMFCLFFIFRNKPKTKPHIFQEEKNLETILRSSLGFSLLGTFLITESFEYRWCWGH